MRSTWAHLSTLSRRLGNTESVENLVIGGTVAAAAAAVVLRGLRGRGPQVPGRMVRANEVHVITHAGNRPTVVFENGLGNPATMWSWIQRGLPAGIASIAYDRPGTGWSPAQGRLSALSYPENLRATMRAVAAYAPLILVGHSSGGLLIRIFARHFPELVGGLVFVDSAHPEQYSRSAAQAAALEQLHNDLDQMIVRAGLGMQPHLNTTRMVNLLPHDVGPATREVMFRAQTLRAARQELRACAGEWTAQAAELTTLGSLPVAVVSAQQSIVKDPVIGRLHDELTELSSVHRRVVVPEADHQSLLTYQPYAAQVTGAITWAIDTLAADREAAGPARAGDRR